MRNSTMGALAAFGAAVLVSSPCVAAEQGVIKARLELDRVAGKVKSLAAGDVPSANRLIKMINRAATYLKGCKDKRAAEWQAQLKRAKELDAKVRARAGQPAGQAQPDQATLAAKRLLDRAEQLLAKLGPGDVPSANKVIEACNDARRKLGEARSRSAKLWAESRKRADAISAKARALAGKQAAPTPDAPTPPPATPKKTAGGNPHGDPPLNRPALSSKDAYYWDRARKIVEKLWRGAAGGSSGDVAGSIRAARSWLKKMRSRSHPRVAWANKSLDALEAKVGKAGGAKPAAPAGTNPLGAPPPNRPSQSARDAAAWTRATQILDGLWGQLAAGKKDPQQIKPGAFTASVQQVRQLLKRLRNRDHARAKWARKSLTAFEGQVYAVARHALDWPETPNPLGAPPPDYPTLSRNDAYYWGQCSQTVEGLWSGISSAKPVDVTAKTFARDLAAARERLGKVKAAAHPRTVWATKSLAAFEERLAKVVREGDAIRARLAKAKADAKAAAKKEAGEVDAELAKIEAFFDPKTFSAVLKPPFPKAKVERWAKQVVDYRETFKQGIAMLDDLVKEHPKYAKDPRIASLRVKFSKILPAKLLRGVNDTTHIRTVSAGTTAGYMPSRINRAKELWGRSKKAGIKDANLADDTWVKRSLKTIDEGIEAARAKNIFNRAWHGRPDWRLDTLIINLITLKGKLAESAKRVIADTRMPKAATTRASLLALAKKTLANKKYGVQPYERLVIYEDKSSHSGRFSSSRTEGRYLKIWTWTEKWEEFRVCTAEEIDGELRLVRYHIKYISVGPHWKPTGRWYVRTRSVGRRILPENVDK